MKQIIHGHTPDGPDVERKLMLQDRRRYVWRKRTRQEEGRGRFQPVIPMCAMPCIARAPTSMMSSNNWPLAYALMAQGSKR